MTKEKVEIYEIQGNHITMLDSNQTASAINGDPIEDAQAFKAEIMGKWNK